MNWAGRAHKDIAKVSSFGSAALWNLKFCEERKGDAKAIMRTIDLGFTLTDEEHTRKMNNHIADANPVCVK
jgi:hypothetical protein